jgi:hypothetical protein
MFKDQTRRSLLINAPLFCVATAAAFGSSSSSAAERTDPPLLVPSAASSAKCKLAIGMNLAGIADWEPGFPFRNLMWGARPWMTSDVRWTPAAKWNTEKLSAFQFDEDGYPLEVPVSVPDRAEPQVIFTLLPNVLKPGRYVVLYDGKGAFAASLGSKIIYQLPGRVVIEMTHNGSLVEVLTITRSVRGDHVRNIRVLAQQDEKADLAANPFRAEFLDFCRPFRALRFMDWAATNGSLEQEWSQRRRPSFYRQTEGIAIEHMIQLCNMLEVDPLALRATPRHGRIHSGICRARASQARPAAQGLCRVLQ